MNLLDSVKNFRTGEIPGVCLSDVLCPNNFRNWSPAFEIAKEMEIQELMSRNASEVVLQEALLPDANVLGGRFCVAVKHLGTYHEIDKACFVA